MANAPLQKQLLSELSPFIRAGRIMVHESDKAWFHLIRHRFPVSLNGIHWDKVPGAESNYEAEPYIPPDGINRAIPIRENENTIRAFLSRFSVSAGIRPDENVIVVGDGITDIALEMTFSSLSETFPILFSYPQHVCIIRPDGTWCFMFTFEFDMHYGKSPYAS